MFRHKQFTNRGIIGKAEVDYKIEISSSVLQRIARLLRYSNDEEGGKFIGRLRLIDKTMVVRIESYLDSGPRMSNSATHILPDGDYQETLFRLIERFDSSIEHVGSWHSHIPNGLSQLSSGDITGYKRNVNNANYNLDIFYVMLVTGLVGDSLDAKHYIFKRGHAEYIEISESNIHIVEMSYDLESCLENWENLSLNYRKDSYLNYKGTNKKSRQNRSHSAKLSINHILAKDRRWLIERFDNIQTRRRKSDGAIAWQWRMSVHRKNITCYYKYPSGDLVEASYALFEARINGNSLLSAKIPINNQRLDALADAINEVSVKASSFNFDVLSCTHSKLAETHKGVDHDRGDGNEPECGGKCNRNNKELVRNQQHKGSRTSTGKNQRGREPNKSTSVKVSKYPRREPVETDDNK